MRYLIAVCFVMLGSLAVAEAQVSTPGRSFDFAMNKLIKVKWISNYDRGFGSDNEFYKLSKEFVNTRDSAEFRRMANQRNPIVRAMGLLCLAQTDWDQFLDFVLSHWQDPETVFLQQGCIVRRLTVGEFVQRLFANPHFLDPRD